MSMHRRDALKLMAGSSAALVVPVQVHSTAPPSPKGQDVTADAIQLGNDRIKVEWHRRDGVWRVSGVSIRTKDGWRDLPGPSGEYGLLNSPTAPADVAVQQGTAGTMEHFWPQRAVQTADGYAFHATLPTGALVAEWRLDPAHPADISVTMTWQPSQTAYYSVPTPALVTLTAAQLKRGLIPGFWSGTTPQSDHDLAYLYGLGVPAEPLTARDRTITTPLALVTTDHDLTLAVVAAPGVARDPWASDVSTHHQWRLGMATSDRRGTFTPIAFHPILGQAGSRVAAGQALTYTFRYVLTDEHWFKVLDHVARDVCRLGRYLELARNARPLTERVATIQRFLSTGPSGWRTWTYNGLTLGAEGDKLSDIGAMWMMRAITGDPVIEHERLPYARNFKLAQQETAAGPFQGAALGEYFRRGGWESENVNNKTPGPNYVSPIFTTFYTLADVGNILLFGADDELRRRVRLAADRLLAWQKPDGSFDVGYLRESPGQLVYPDLTDYRATWYGLLVAHRVLGDPACLQAARRGADWFIANALRTGRFLGVCDDARLPRDFQVIFAAQALLELAEVTGEARYRHAAIETAQHYATQVYTHPTPSTQPRTFNDHEVEQWQTSQAGLSFEHAGFSGSAPSRGPILLAAHAGAFVRFAELTGEQLFLDMARAAARGRDEWVDPASGWPSYYWNAGNTESGKFPWHGWWHLGWMIDYLLAEARLRSQGRISFPRGFMTAKVGASAPYGFAAGTVYSRAARLWMPPGLVKGDNPEVDVLTAMSTQGRTLLVIALNGRPENQTATLTIDPRSVSPGELADMTGWRSVAGSLTRVGELAWKTTIPAYGHAVLSVDLTLSPDPQGQQPRSLEVTGMPRSPVVAWSYWKATTSWAEWREAGGTAWKGTPAQDGYRFRAPLDLSGVPAGDVQIRLACKASDGSVGYSQPIVHRVYDPDGPNLALGRPVEASSVYSAAYPPEKAVDGDRADTASRWLSAVGDGRPTFTVTLAAAAALRLVRVYSGGTLQRQVAVDFDVEARSGGGWTTVATVRGNTSPMADVLLSSVTADAVRLVFLRPSSDAVNVARIFEVEVYDKLK